MDGTGRLDLLGCPVTEPLESCLKSQMVQLRFIKAPLSLILEWSTSGAPPMQGGGPLLLKTILWQHHFQGGLILFGMMTGVLEWETQACLGSTELQPHNPLLPCACFSVKRHTSTAVTLAVKKYCFATMPRVSVNFGIIAQVLWWETKSFWLGLHSNKHKASLTPTRIILLSSNPIIEGLTH